MQNTLTIESCYELEPYAEPRIAGWGSSLLLTPLSLPVLTLCGRRADTDENFCKSKPFGTIRFNTYSRSDRLPDPVASV